MSKSFNEIDLSNGGNPPCPYPENDDSEEEDEDYENDDTENEDDDYEDDSSKTLSLSLYAEWTNVFTDDSNDSIATPFHGNKQLNDEISELKSERSFLISVLTVFLLLIIVLAISIKKMDKFEEKRLQRPNGVYIVW